MLVDLLQNTCVSRNQNADSDDCWAMQTNCVFRNQSGEENPKLAITVRGPGQSMTVATISQMSPADFSSLWTVCVFCTIDVL